MSSVPESATTQPAPSVGEPGQATAPERLRAVVASYLRISQDDLQPGTELGRDLCMDSLAAAELLVVIEDSMHIVILTEVLADRDRATYGDLEKIVLDRLAAS